MTFEQILDILKDTSRTPYQIAADLHAILNQPVKKPSALTLTPMKERKPRGPNKPKGGTLSPIDNPPSNGSGHDHE